MNTSDKGKGFKRNRRSVIVQPDDLQVGTYYAVYGAKGIHEPVPIAGEAFQVKAINLPFVVGRMVNPQAPPAVTFDVRYLDFMRITEDYAKAQAVPANGDDGGNLHPCDQSSL